jgi:hypothetical protein
VIFRRCARRSHSAADGIIAGMRPNDPVEGDLRDAVRVELAQLRNTFVGDPSMDGDAAQTEAETVARALARIRQRDTGKVGRLGERIARVPRGKCRIPSLTGSARYRVPDILTDNEIIEVKNVARLSLTPQLADFTRFAESSSRAFVLITRFDTILTSELQGLVDEGRIEHRHLTGLLSSGGRRLIRRMIQETLGDNGKAESESGSSTV